MILLNLAWELTLNSMNALMCSLGAGIMNCKLSVPSSSMRIEVFVELLSACRQPWMCENLYLKQRQRNKLAY